MRWLTKPSIAPVLSDLTTGRLQLTHQALDELPDSQPLAHLRQTLVAVGALPERDELGVRLEKALTHLLASQHDTERRNLLHRYLIWNLLRRHRSRNNGRSTTRQQSLLIRRLARGAIAFLDWLHAHAAILARTLGIHTDVAVTWQRHSAGEWATYAADVSRRDARHSNSSNT